MIKRVHKFFHHHYHTRYHGIYKHAKQLFVFDLALLGLALVMFASGLYFFLWKPGERHLAQVQVLLGNDRIKSGDNVTVTIKYTNTSKYILREPTLSVHLPSGFEMDRATSTENVFRDRNTIQLEDLVPGASGAKLVTGRLFSTPGVEDRITGILTFLPDGEKEREQEATPFNFTLPESVLRGSLSVVSSTYPGKTIPVVYVLENTSKATVKEISLETNTGRPFFAEKDMEAFSLGANATRTFYGNITTPSSGGSFELGVTPRVSINGVLLPQSQTKEKVTIFNPNISIRAAFVTPPAYTEAGARLPITVEWKNDGSYTINNQTIELSFTNGVIDLNTTASANGVKTDGTKLIITKKERTALAEGKPGSTGRFELTLHLLPRLNLGEVENEKLSVEPAFIGEVSTVANQSFRFAGPVIDLPLATELSWVGQARYYTDDGEQLGRGPLPPRVGQTTRYFILFDVYNTSNMISDASFVARLPEGVVFTGKQSVTLGPKLMFDSGSRLVRWNYPQVPANSQTGFYFEIAVTPTGSQTGQTVTLLEDARFTAKDDVVGKPFSLGKGIITNVLPSLDEGARAGATVR